MQIPWQICVSARRTKQHHQEWGWGQPPPNNQHSVPHASCLMHGERFGPFNAVCGNCGVGLFGPGPVFCCFVCFSRVGRYANLAGGFALCHACAYSLTWVFGFSVIVLFSQFVYIFTKDRALELNRPHPEEKKNARAT